MDSLNILPKENAKHDFLALGALVTRLDPGQIPFSHANDYQVHVSGGEYNVAANLAGCFNLNTAIASAMVDYPIGKKVRREVAQSGVTPYYVNFKHDGVRGPTIAQVWSDQGKGVRAPVVFYNRSNEAAALLDGNSFDWGAIFAGGIRWFHSGGIFCALSQTTPEVVLSGIKAARKAGAIVSFDLNFRAKLWNTMGGADKAPEILRGICSNVDILIGNEEDLQLGLGLKGPYVEKAVNLDPTVFLTMMKYVAKDFPNIKAVATTLREVHHANKHSWSAVLWLDGRSHTAPVCELSVLDRVGGGDGFASGLIYGLLSGKSPEAALKLGWAHGALLTTFPGDTSMATLEQVDAFAVGGSARIQR
jgi:2-dehydro-3-deoxygluconokinase